MRIIPQIYESTVTSLNNFGLGGLPDALKCEVTEERNGEFYCEMTYTAFGQNADLIKVGRILAVKPNMYDDIQAFRIAEIEKTLDGEMSITAYHISYDLANVVVMPFTASSASGAMSNLFSYSVPASAFTVSTDITSTATFTVSQPAPLRNLLVGMAGSMVDVYGGELKFDNWHVSLLQARGQDRNVQIAYGKNLNSFTETDTLGKYDGVVPFAVYNETAYYLTPAGPVVTAPIVWAHGNSGTYGYPRLIMLDLSEDFSDAAPTQSQLYQKTQSYIRYHSTDSTANMATGFLDLQKLIGSTERVDLCDTVHLSVLPYHVNDLSLKAITTVYDALLDEYKSIQVGDRKITLADELAPILKS